MLSGKTLLVINIKVILYPCKLVLYPRMVSGPNNKISIMFLNKSYVFVYKLLFALFFVYAIVCVFFFKLEFSTSSFLSMEKLHINGVIFLIL